MPSSAGSDPTTWRRRVERWTLALDAAARRRLATDLDEVAAVVPGCVHTDLLAGGLIADPYDDLNELGQQWIGLTDWTYRTTVDLTPPVGGSRDWRAELVFHGLDTFATVTLGGAELGRTRNQHRMYRFDVTDQVRDAADGGGPAQLVVELAAPRRIALGVRERLGDLPNPYGEPYNFVRKMACNFGWDWGPTLTTSGIWRPVDLVFWHTARLADVRVDPRPARSGRLDVEVSVAPDTSRAVEHADGLHVVVEVTGPQGEVATATVSVGDGTATAALDLADVERWRPRGRGGQPRYQVAVSLIGDDGPLDVWRRAVGFRDVEARRTPDEHGETFELVVDGERLWVRGVNWIPADCFPARVGVDDVRARLTQAAEANADLVRVWGGGVYESDEFYDICDELGLLVWQDFAFACAAYPEAELWDEVAAEARDNIVRLRHHPSLAVWNGNNENLEGWADWGWQDVVGDRPWGDGFYHDLLPALVAELDPGRPYLDGSPTSFDTGAGPNDDRYGLVHLWDAWNDHDYDHYATHHPRFVAEFGYQAPATWRTLRLDRPGAPTDIDDPRLRHRQRAFDGHAKIERWRAERFGEIGDLDTWLYQTQLNQARAVTESVGHFRSLHETCSGVIWWQLDDCWPAISWAVVDGDGREKPAYSALRRSFDDRLVAIRPSDGAPSIVLVNDGVTPWVADLDLVVCDAGTSTRSVRIPCDVAARGVRHHDVPARLARDLLAGSAVLVVTVDGRRAWWSPVDDVARGADDVPRFDLDVRPTAAGVAIEVTARTLVRDLCCFADRVTADARVDEQMITLLPGERHRFLVTAENADPGAWRRAIGAGPVLRAACDRADG